MSELFRKVMCSERLPEKGGWYSTDQGRMKFHEMLNASNGGFYKMAFQDLPEWWMERVKEPTDEEIEAKAKKKWGTIKGRFAFRQGYKQAIEYLKGEKK